MGRTNGTLGGSLYFYTADPTFHQIDFHRVYAEGGILIIMALLWGCILDGCFDSFDLIGSAIAT
jgi:drug/metabolite transporter superfamily protein YnfA